jgi:hypothetical protein
MAKAGGVVLVLENSGDFIFLSLELQPERGVFAGAKCAALRVIQSNRPCTCAAEHANIATLKHLP